MSWLLDTNACIRYLNGRAPHLRQRIDETGPESIVVCSIVKAELHYGALRSRDPERAVAAQQRFVSRFRSIPFDDACAHSYGEIRARLAAQGTPIGPNDLLIAAIALTHGLRLVSANIEEFGRVPGLIVEDWERGGA